jgi:NADP-dependent 3-hydroxy acid dehydrogenase YdfG
MSKSILITGGGSGVGKAIAAKFLAAGWNVAISGRDDAKLQAAAAELGHATQLLTIAGDVSDPELAAAIIATATKVFGHIDVLVNNAGANVRNRALRDLSIDDWNTLIRTNLDGAFYCLHAVLPQMLARRDGVIVNIVSVAGKRANPLGGAAYIAAKFGMGGLGMCLSNEERESGVRVSNIYPGEIDTPILAQRPKPVTDEQRAVILKPDDVASAVFFVATLPPHVSVPELVIKPTAHTYW